MKTHEVKGYISELPFKGLLKVLISPGEKTKYEAHETSEEILCILFGMGKVMIDDIENKISPGMLIALPEGSIY
ncbi:MAG: hypothetical protein A2163_10505 [Actinobacteria bacterium RBG_13_35_12]|uniref:Cupin 2 conserved barrel domain-containing protein n=1 Tax=Candidatus Sediminicultor quintus TaxID=1797291 RepID=A0A1F5A5S8_9BACT|nr:MAG: hypothetical protein A2163_10505 [Actinobacteria bacterium RBG_13_35_12]OGD13930.1 MAG: hypothetical protein A2V47_03810 [Candidatus Atribacteria bacterium RBG_19FT_COMBO_35_14]